MLIIMNYFDGETEVENLSEWAKTVGGVIVRTSVLVKEFWAFCFVLRKRASLHTQSLVYSFKSMQTFHVEK